MMMMMMKTKRGELRLGRWSTTLAIAILALGCGADDRAADRAPEPTQVTVAAQSEPGPHAAVEEALLGLINADRAASDAPPLERDPGHDYLIGVYTAGLARDQTLGDRQVEELAREHARWDRLSCTEITQWWGGEPSADVHIDALRASGAPGKYGDPNVRFVGLSVISGKGPAGSQHESRDGSYLGVVLCKHPFRLVTDPAAD